MPRVDAILSSMKVALRSPSVAALLNDIEEWAIYYARESMVTRETFASYAGNARTECHLAAAILFLEFLEASEHKIRNTTAAEHARSACQQVLVRSRKRRFDWTGTQDPARDNASINRSSGAYAVLRVESHFAELNQELLVLCPSRGKERERYGLLIGRNVVIRGHWHLFGATVCLTGVGFGMRHRPNFVTLSFPAAEPTDLMPGLVTLQSEDRTPVALRALIVPLSEYSRHVGKLVDLSDSSILQQFGKLVPMRLPRGRLGNLRDDRSQGWFSEQRAEPGDRFVAAIRGTVGEPRKLFPELVRFCGRWK